ncbi:MAG TPA: hypothetical protein VF988_01105 [Verrucomicrobiae bacterium]
MRWFITQSTEAFRECLGFKKTEAGKVTQSPIAGVFLVCLAGFFLMYYTARPIISLLGIWWLKLLGYGSMPTAIAFVILYRSYWHEEIVGPARVCLIAFVSVMILGGALMASVLGAVVAWLYLFAVFGDTCNGV